MIKERDWKTCTFFNAISFSRFKILANADNIVSKRYQKFLRFKKCLRLVK